MKSESETEILRDLNPEQVKAVTCVEGPVLIVAGAGSGKTRVLTSRIAYLIEKGVPAERILALTFTKKAAGEMKERVADMVGERSARRLWMGTFHSVFIRFLREYADAIGFPPAFTIYDTTDSVNAVKTCLKQLQLDDKTYKPKEVLSRISKAKNDLVTPTPYMNGAGGYREDDNRHKKPEIYRAYAEYCRQCRQAGVMDFDDILLYMNILLRDCKEALDAIAGRFSYILVDEYQDTNMAQYLILRKLAAGHKNLCVVGDDSQSIYGFRGAQITNILNFQKDFPEARLFRLERNYRSTRNIVNAANTLIAHNEGRIPKNCVSMGDEGEKIHLVRASDGENEARMIATSILDRLREDACEYEDFAVLYRTNSQSRELETQLRRWNVPFRVFGTQFYDRAEVKDVISYLKVIVNPSDNEAIKRIINKPSRGIGDTSVASWEKAASQLGCSLYEAAFHDNLEALGMKNAAIQKIRPFCQILKHYSDQVETTSAADIANGILQDSGLLLYYKTDTSIEGMSRLKNVEEVINDIASKQQAKEERVRQGEEDDQRALTLLEYLEDIALLSAVDNDDEDVSNRVSLMTIHTAKGLEFRHVYVCGLEENIFPSGGWLITPQDLEEERRLFYVAITRAKKTLTLSYANQRFRNGKTEFNAPSRFLRELAPQYLDHPLRRGDFTAQPAARPEGEGFSWRSSRPSAQPPRPSTSFQRPSPQPIASFQRPSPQPSRTVLQDKPPLIDPDFVPDPMSSFSVGDAIEHNRFGAGKVLEISGKVPDLKAKILFEKYGEKLLLLKFAKIRHI